MLTCAGDKAFSGRWEDSHFLIIVIIYLTGVIQTDSSSDEESSEAEEESDLEHEWGELDADAETTDESTKRCTDLIIVAEPFTSTQKV